MRTTTSSVPRKRKMEESMIAPKEKDEDLSLSPNPIQKSKKRKLNSNPDFEPTKKRLCKKKQPQAKRSAGYKGSTDQAKKLCEYCHQHSTLSSHGRFYLCNSTTQPGLKICNACKSWEYRNGNLVPRDQRRKNTRRSKNTRRYFDPTTGTSVEVCSDSSDTETDNLPLSLNNSPDMCPPGQTSEFEGISWDATFGKWKAEYGKGSEFHSVGLFDHETDAANAYAQTVASRRAQSINESESLPFIKLISTDDSEEAPSQETNVCEYCNEPSKDDILRLSGFSKMKLCLECYQYEAVHKKLVPKGSRFRTVHV